MRQTISPRTGASFLLPRGHELKIVDPEHEQGELKVEPPRSKAGNYIIIRAEMDLIVGLTACSAEQSNNYAFKPIEYQILTPQ